MLATLASNGCAYNATGASLVPNLIFSFTIEGSQFVSDQNVAYYFVLNTDGDPAHAPQVDGPAPRTFAYPDPRAYLPFIRDESTVLDQEPVPVPSTFWDHYFAMYQEAGQMVMWMGVKNHDGSVNERARPMQQGREWGINGNSVQITIPYNIILSAEQMASLPAEPGPLPGLAQFNCNLATATRGQGINLDVPPPVNSEHLIIDRWGPGGVPFQYFSIPTGPGQQSLYDTGTGVRFPENVPGGLDARNLNIISLNYRVVWPE